MVVVLILLVFVMQQAGQPRFYAIFFEDPAQLAAENEFGDEFNAALMTTQRQRVRKLKTAEPTRQLANALTSSLTLNQQRQWTAILSRWNAGKPFPLVRSVVEETNSLIEDLTDVDPDQQAAWIGTLTRFGNLYAESELVVGGERPAEDTAAEEPGTDQRPADAVVAGELADQDAVRLIAWFESLDQAALDRVVDASVWRSADFDAFYLQLDQAKTLSGQGATSAAVVQLLQQPDIYRGKLIRVVGQIARAEQLDATANPHSIDKYWQLWIQPETGSDRPIVVVTPSLTPQVAQLVRQDGHPRVRFVGRFFKSLAYRSQLGADLAPVVIARMAVAPPTTAKAADRAQGEVTGRMSDGQRFILTLILASVVGVTIAAYTMWRSAVSAKRHRDLRSRCQQPEFPGSLSELDAGNPKEQAHE